MEKIKEDTQTVHISHIQNCEIPHKECKKEPVCISLEETCSLDKQITEGIEKSKDGSTVTKCIDIPNCERKEDTSVTVHPDSLQNCDVAKNDSETEPDCSSLDKISSDEQITTDATQGETIEYFCSLVENMKEDSSLAIQLDDVQNCEEPQKKSKAKRNISHQRTPREKKFICVVCQKGFGTKSNLVRHLRVHTGDKPTVSAPLEKKFFCPVCQKGFGIKCNLVKHMRVHTGDKPYVCEICQRGFSSKDNLDKHRKKHFDQPHVCKICQKTFKRETNLVRHNLAHADEEKFLHAARDRKRRFTERLRLSGVKPHVCSVCTKAFYHKTALNNHLRTHTGEKPHVCDICYKAFCQKSTLNAHKLIHTGEKRHSCKVCQKAFTSKSNLNFHVLSHTSEKPHVCDICQKGFLRRNRLIEHIRIHTGEKPHVCVACGRRFNRKSCLDLHLRTHKRQLERAIAKSALSQSQT